MRLPSGTAASGVPQERAGVNTAARAFGGLPCTDYRTVEAVVF